MNSFDVYSVQDGGTRRNSYEVFDPYTNLIRIVVGGRAVRRPSQEPLGEATWLFSELEKTAFPLLSSSVRTFLVSPFPSKKDKSFLTCVLKTHFPSQK